MRPRARRLVLVLLTSLMALPQAGQALLSVHGNLVVTPVPVAGTPHVLDGEVFAILPMGHRVYVGGNFTQVRNAGTQAVLTRRGLFAFDTTSGLVDPGFLADFDGAVQALAAAPDGVHIFAGGDFGSLNGLPQRKLAKISGTNAAPAAGFSVSLTSQVNDIVVTGDRLILAGAFSSLNGAPRGGLAAVSATTGALDPGLDIPFTTPRRGSNPGVRSIALSPNGTVLVAAGNFSLAGGLPRFQIALVDLGSRPARVLDWQTNRFDDRHTGRTDPDGFWCSVLHDTFMRDVDFSPDGRYFVVVTTGRYSDQGPLCDAASRWETSDRGSGLQPTWVDLTGGDTLTAVAVTDAVVYVGGHQRWLNNWPTTATGGTAGPGSVAREGLAALDPRSGLPRPWNPGRERGEGVWALVTTPAGLWVGSDTDRIGGAYHPKLAFLPLAGGSTAPVVAEPSLPADVYSIGLDGRVSRRPFDGNVMGVATPLPGTVDWSRVRAAFPLGEWLYTAQDDGRLLRRTRDGEELGAANLRGLTSSQFPIARLTGMFFDNGRLYYTVAGDRHLWYRNFLAETAPADDVVGAQTFRAGGIDDSLDWSRVKGMTLVGGKIYRFEGAELQRIDFLNGRAQPGTLTIVAAAAGLDARALFLVPRPVPPTPPPATLPPATVTPPPPSPLPPAPGAPKPGFVASRASGYWMVGRDGTVHAFGGAAHHGHATNLLGLSARVVDLEPTPSSNGYWILDDAGRVHTFGDARHRGDPRARLTPGERAASLSATASGAGYWVFTTRGRVLAFGDAGHFGDLATVTLNAPVVDSVRTPTGRGYYLVASDGGIFTFGDARFRGSMGGTALNAPVQSLVPDPDAAGYWLVAADGGVFSFEAPFRGSLGATPLNRPVTGMVPFGTGYLMVGEDGGIFNFSDRPFSGSLGDRPPPHPVVAVAAVG
jgi:hypothetical protein